ncbi:hypothetical protein EIP86_010758, partial [Pleurotus ostreatoroseus]
MAPAPALRPRRGLQIDDEALTVYTDGARIHDETGARAGSGIWYGASHPANKAIRVPPTLPQTNQVGELVAVLTAARNSPPFAPLHIVSDSQYVIDGLTRRLPIWEAHGWI